MSEEKNITPIYQFPYAAGEDGCLYFNQITASGSTPKRICNFTPYIVSQITVDDGDKTETKIILGGTHADGRRLNEIEITCDDFNSFSWVCKKWGYECNLDVGQKVREHLRFALQSTAPNAKHITVYKVTGWKKINDEWYYLMPGDSEMTVSLDGKLAKYFMKREFTSTDIAVASSMFDLPLVISELLYPLLAFVFLSPLNEFLRRADCEPKTALMLIGKTGAGKSTLAALMLSFFGDFEASDMPLSFRDTANSIIYHTFALKDVLTCIDDFHPGSKAEESRLTETAQAVMRAYGDRVGRGRLNSSSMPMESRYPQGNAILTAEFVPDIGESGTARCFGLEIKIGDIDFEILSMYQEEARKGTLQSCMFAYTKWIKDKFLSSENNVNEFCTSLRQIFNEYRSDFRKRTIESSIKCHARIPEDAAWMKIGFGMYLDFLSDKNMITAEKSVLLKREFDDIVFGIAERQAKTVEADKPTHKFILKMFALIESGQYTMPDRSYKAGTVPQDCIGCKDEKFYYIFTGTAHKAVRQICESQGETFTISERGLLKALCEEGLLEAGQNQNTKPIRFCGEQRHMMCLNRDKVDAVIERYS